MALTQNIMIAYNDYVQTGFVYSSQVTFDPTAPLSNALLPELENQAIMTPQAGEVTEFVIDLFAQKPLNLIALLKHNINFTGKWRVRLNADIVNDPVGQEYDSGWQTVIPPQTGFGALAWGQFLWGGAVPEYNLGKYNRHAYMPLPDTVFARYITVTIDAPANTSNIEFFRLWASTGYQPSTNIQYGAEIIPIDDTQVFQAAAGNRRYGDPVQRRSLHFGWDMLPKAEMLYNIVGGLYLASGTFTPFIVLISPLDPSNFYVESVYGNLKDVSKASYAFFGQFESELEIEEAV